MTNKKANMRVKLLCLFLLKPDFNKQKETIGDQNNTNTLTGEVNFISQYEETIVPECYPVSQISCILNDYIK